ncbi:MULTISPECIES: EAL domain-containing protein [Burkholderia cepacia complex]|uniref:EAL domain-containing protein n=1 Tax=Burkholderia ubonensis TaxID=101571 RepID=A0A1B4LHH3_9BURK|nr:MULTISPECIES: EAL domain-containing protein [Burkholderia cepacia complex]AOJ76646.1 hypothetical protein WJ35_16250 [Burkholderia ubonensis]AOK13733.1 hypothetical protein WK31_25700 [Burkholderia vietnamiensis]
MIQCVKALMQRRLAQDMRRHADSDLGLAGTVLAAIAQDRVMLWAQPIVSVRDDAAVLYHECLVRIVDADGLPIVYPSEFIPSLERLELMRFVDRYIVSMAIDLMDSNVDLRLGINISAQSANNFQWWESIFLILENRPDIACRLVVEITETTQLSSVSGRMFVERLRLSGCAIAVDDFGDGFSLENSTHIAQLDIVKIAGRMLPADCGDQTQCNRFKKLVARARCHAKQVVVEGIEGIAGLRTAVLSGAQWVQGYHIGRPVRLGKSEFSTVGSIEKSLQQFERIADALMDWKDEEKTRDDARLAYAFGLSSVLYGRHSAIATGLGNGLNDVIRMNFVNLNKSDQFLQCFVKLGLVNGQTLVDSFVSGTSS